MKLRKSPVVLILSLLASGNVYSTKWVKEIAFEGAAKPSLAIGADTTRQQTFLDFGLFDDESRRRFELSS